MDESATGAVASSSGASSPDSPSQVSEAASWKHTTTIVGARAMTGELPMVPPRHNTTNSGVM